MCVLISLLEMAEALKQLPELQLSDGCWESSEKLAEVCLGRLKSCLCHLADMMGQLP